MYKLLAAARAIFSGKSYFAVSVFFITCFFTMLLYIGTLLGTYSLDAKILRSAPQEAVVFRLSRDNISRRDPVDVTEMLSGVKAVYSG